jgi:RecA/RadA recombinase
MPAKSKSPKTSKTPPKSPKEPQKVLQKTSNGGAPPLPEIDLEAQLAIVRNRVGQLDGAVLYRADELTNVYRERRPTGICGLDRILRGGLGSGCHYVIAGTNNSGKDMLVNRALATNQQIHGDKSGIAIIYLEGEWDKQFARMGGMSVAHSDLEIAQLERDQQRAFTQEERQLLTYQAGHIEILQAVPAEVALEAARIMAESGAFQYIVINSIDALVREDEMEAVESKGIGNYAAGQGGRGRAQLISAAFRNLMLVMLQPIILQVEKIRYKIPRKTTFLWIAQYRTKQAGQYTRLDFGGGEALRHYAAAFLEVSRVYEEKYPYMGIGEKKSHRHIPVSNLVHIQCTKGKYGHPDGLGCEFRFFKHRYKKGDLSILPGAIDEPYTIRTSLQELGLLLRDKEGISLYLPGEDPLPMGRSVQEVEDALEHNIALQDHIRRSFLNMGNPWEIPLAEEGEDR